MGRKFLLSLLLVLPCLPLHASEQIPNNDDTLVIASITAGEYCAFLNSTATTDFHGLYDQKMAFQKRAVLKSGSPGNYSYAVSPGEEQELISFTSWLDQARFCNWIENGRLGLALATEERVYDLSNNSFVAPQSSLCALPKGDFPQVDPSLRFEKNKFLVRGPLGLLQPASYDLYSDFYTTSLVGNMPIAEEMGDLVEVLAALVCTRATAMMTERARGGSFEHAHLGPNEESMTSPMSRGSGHNKSRVLEESDSSAVPGYLANVSKINTTGTSHSSGQRSEGYVPSPTGTWSPSVLSQKKPLTSRNTLKSAVSRKLFGSDLLRQQKDQSVIQVAPSFLDEVTRKRSGSHDSTESSSSGSEIFEGDPAFNQACQDVSVGEFFEANIYEDESSVSESRTSSESEKPTVVVQATVLNSRSSQSEQKAQLISGYSGDKGEQGNPNLTHEQRTSISSLRALFEKNSDEEIAEHLQNSQQLSKVLSPFSIACVHQKTLDSFCQEQQKKVKEAVAFQKKCEELSLALDKEGTLSRTERLGLKAEYNEAFIQFQAAAAAFNAPLFDKAESERSLAKAHSLLESAKIDEKRVRDAKSSLFLKWIPLSSSLLF